MAAAVDSPVEAMEKEQHSEASKSEPEEEPCQSPELGSKSEHEEDPEEEPEEEPCQSLELGSQSEQEEEPCHSLELGSKSEPEEAQFQFPKLSYVDELGSLSSAIRAFQFRFNELQDHLGFIHNAIDTRTRKLISSSNSHRDNHPQPPSLEETNHSSTIEKNSEDASSLSELQNLCKTMCSRGLRKYLVSHLSDVPALRDEIPLALKLAPNPAKIVYYCIGRFYLQGSKAYTKDSPMVAARQASILILELFLLSGAAEAENYNQIQMIPSLKVEAYLAATAWRKRLVTEAGSCKSSDIDARGLLLFLASFGIPSAFTNDDLRDLLRSCNYSKEICNALRRSPAFLSRIPEIIKGMAKNSMDVEAVDIVYAFGLEDEFPPHEILVSFLQACDETWKKKINEGRDSTMQLRRVNEEKLASLKRVLKCLEDHKLDPVKSLPGWKIHEMINNLGKDMVELEKRIVDNATLKRKTDVASTQKYLSQEIKRSRIAAASKGGFSAMSYPVNGSSDQNATTFLDDKSNFSTSSMPQTLLDGVGAAQLGNYQIASTFPGTGVVETTVLPSPSEIGTSITSTGSFPRDSNEASIYNMGQTHEFAFKVQQAMPTHATAPTPTPPAESYPTVGGFIGHTTSNHSDLYHFADSAVFESGAPKQQQ